MSLQRTWIELLNTYGFGLQSFYELFEASKFWWNRPSMEGQKSLTFIKFVSFVFWRRRKALWVWNDI